MNRMSGWLCATMLAAAPVLGCDRVESTAESPVEGEIEDVQEARGQTGAEIRRLQDELAEAKQRVVELEKKLALARQGITDDVLQERKELGEVLKEERQEVRGEVTEAQESAEQHNRATQKAERVLEETTPPRDVEADVESRSRVTPGAEQDVERTQDQENIVIEDVRGVEEQERERGDTREPEPQQQPQPLEQPQQPAPAER